MSEEKDTVEQPQQEETVTETVQNQSESQDQIQDNAASAPSNDDLSVLRNELEEQKSKYLRLFAEFDNFKKRSAKERLELFKTAGQDIIRELLPVLDDFQRADKAFQQDNNAENYANGVRLIQEKMQKTLQQKGLKVIESIGKDFNVEFHEAIAEVPAPDEAMKGKIIDEVECGYTLNDAIIRYAKVVVGK
ncbi:MAG: nucleotide exchange factor GrpE [Chitinophagales bacterium]